MHAKMSTQGKVTAAIQSFKEATLFLFFVLGGVPNVGGNREHLQNFELQSCLRRPKGQLGLNQVHQFRENIRYEHLEMFHVRAESTPAFDKEK